MSASVRSAPPLLPRDHPRNAHARQVYPAPPMTFDVVRRCRRAVDSRRAAVHVATWIDVCTHEPAASGVKLRLSTRLAGDRPCLWVGVVVGHEMEIGRASLLNR